MGIYAELDAEHIGFLPHTAQPVQSCINAFDCLVVSFFLYLLVGFRDRRRRGGLPPRHHGP